MTRAQAVEQLMQSGRGQHALRVLLDWIELNGLGLDAHNQNAVMLLLREAWGPEPRSTLDMIREALLSTSAEFECANCGYPRDVDSSSRCPSCRKEAGCNRRGAAGGVA